MNVDISNESLFLPLVRMEDENLLFGMFLREGNVKLAISMDADSRRLPRRTRRDSDRQVPWRASIAIDRCK